MTMRRFHTWLFALTVAWGCADDPTKPELAEPYPGAIRDSSGMHSDEFGSAMAVGEGTLAVGAPSSDAAAPDAGQVVLYSISSGALPELTRLVRPDSTPQWGDAFGAALAFGASQLVIGAPGIDADDGQDAGAVFIFTSESGEWLYEETVWSPMVERDQRFGSSVAIDGDLLFIGAPGADLDARNVGAVFAFRREEAGYVPLSDTAGL